MARQARAMMSAPCFFALSVLLYCVSGRAQLVNTVVDRKIDVSDATEVVTIALTMRNDGGAPESSFLFAVDQKEEGRVGDLFVVHGKPLKKNRTSKLSVSLDNLSDKRSTYKVQLQNPLQPGQEVTVGVHIDIISSLRPVPSEIKAKEHQFVKYTGNAYFFSPYHTKEMKTTITLGSSKVTSKFVAPEPNSLKGSTAVLGPYTDVAPYASSPLSVRFRNDRGFLIARKALLHYHVSHWGRIGVHEEFEIENHAAKLVGEWSRVDYDRNMGIVDPTSHGDIWANLPPDAENVKYKDLIGNITTSRLRRPARGFRALQLVFRFPLLGGWKNHFWYTYDTLLENHVKSKGDSHVITVPVFPSLNYDLRCDELEVRVSLPEGATGIEFVPHSTIDFSVGKDFKKTALGIAARPTVVLRRKHIRSKSKHGQDVSIRYKFSTWTLLYAPAVAMTGAVAFLLILFVFSRTDWVLVRDEEEEERQKKIDEEMKKISQSHSTIAKSYLALQGLYNDVCRGAVDDVNSKRMTISESLVKDERLLEAAGDRLCNLKPSMTATVKELTGLLKQKREYAMRFLSIEKAFHSGDMQRSNYEQEMKRTVPVSKTLSKDVSNIFQELTTNH